MAKQVQMEKAFDQFSEERLAAYREQAEAKGNEFKQNSAERKVARDYLKEFTANEANLSIVPEIADALKRLFGARSGGDHGSVSTPKSKIRNAIRDALLENGMISEAEVFNTSVNMGGGWGRAEMKSAIKTFIKADPADRLWVELQMSPDEPMGQYVLVGSGPDAPKGWEGYLPTETEVDL